MTHSLLSILLLGSLMSPALGQDIFERAREENLKKSATGSGFYSGRDRIDLALSADLRSAGLTESRGTGRVGVDAAIDLDFACGKFDVGASLKSLLARNVREEFLGSIFGWLESELTKNAMVLLCEASPTFCQALQHYRISANAMLGMSYDRCRAIEEAVDGALEREHAGALKACLAEKEKAGVPLDRALEECRGSDKIRSLTGEHVVEIDLVTELKKALGLTDLEVADLESLLGNRVKYTSQGGKGEIAKDAVEGEYRRIRERYEKNWLAAVEDLGQGRAPSADTLPLITPPGSPRVTLSELAEISLLRPSLRQVVVSSVASQCALLELVRKVHEVERNIEAARKLPTASEDLIARLEREQKDMRSELARLIETHARQNELNRSLLEAMGVARQGVATQSTAALGQLVLDERRFKVDEETQRWGGRAVPEKGKGSRTTGPGCGDCGSGEWSFGSMGGKK